MTKLTRDEAMVLFQLNGGIADFQEIADILPDQDLEDVKNAMRSLREKGLVRVERKRIHITHHGDEALKTHHRQALGL